MRTVHSMTINLPAPYRDFGSDNRSGISPAALSGLILANKEGRVDSYGNDKTTTGANEALADLFDQEVYVVWVPTGTAANVTAISSLVQGPGECVLLAEDSHIRVDECGAIERICGLPLVALRTSDGLLCADSMKSAIERLTANAPFSPKPSILSIAEISETGRRHGLGRIDDLCQEARRNNMSVHIDGARFANALVEDKELVHIFKAGVSTLAFGGTKNGQGPVEAVVTCSIEIHSKLVRAAKQFGHTVSKSRFATAGIKRSLQSGEFLHNARAANAKARELGALLMARGLPVATPTDGNLVFVRVPAPAAATINSWSRVSTWDDNGLIRLACSWDHETEDILRLAEGILSVATSTTAN